MGHYRRALIPGGTYFFTVVTHERRPLFEDGRNIAALRTAFGRVRSSKPFVIEAIVVLPDHLHCMLSLPNGDSDYSGRWREIKKAASLLIDRRSDLRHERPVWQRRFWEHAIRDARDWRNHMDYVHFNPVKHGLAACAGDWPWSSFSRCVARGWYEPSWGDVAPAEIAEWDFE